MCLSLYVFVDWFVYLFTYISHKHQLKLSQPCYSQLSYSLGAIKNIELLVLTFEICRVYNDYYRFAGMTMGIWWLIDPGSTDWINTLARSLCGRRYHPAAVRWLDHVRSPIFGWVKTRCLLAWVQFIDCHPHAACLQCFLTTLHNQWFWDGPLEAAIERKASPIKHGAVMSSLSPCNGAICVFEGRGGSKFHLWPAHPVRSKMLSGGVVAWGDADSGGDCSWLSAELQDVQVLSTVGWSMEFLVGLFGSSRVIVAWLVRE